MSDDEWEEIKNQSYFFNNNLFEDCRGDFGTLNFFAIVGALDLLRSEQGRYRIDDMKERRLEYKSIKIIKLSTTPNA